MDHAPFIWSAYAASALILLWTAIAPLFRKRQALRKIQMANRGNQTHDTQP